MKIFEIISIIFNIIFGFTAAILAVKNHNLNKRIQQVTHYKDRKLIFDKVRKYIANIVKYGNIETECPIQFARDTKDAKFLFGDDIMQYINKLYRKGIDMNQMTKELIKVAGNKEKEEKLINKQRKIHEWFQKQLKEKDRKFEKYLKTT
ncbi:MAG: hypothetical protein K9L87_01405 [Candidatus Omnitrophica bacterium]|nr:hypothetical protein [Candidatus Omnitrophota bacterium]MCF7897400.1 hypothetical protein [Candidatus Omnitrophota bacterium]MCF7909493.1 hypothetical protein [Candidatus Omnitrophota bacterium]